MSAEQAFEQLRSAVRDKRAATAVGLFGLAGPHAVLALSRIRPVVFLCRSGQLDDVVRDLRFLAGPAADRVLALPADDRTPYHASSPDPLIVMERMATLTKLAAGQPFDVLVLPPESAARRGVPFAEVQRLTELVAKDGDLDRFALQQRLIAGGYSQVNTVEDPGTFAVRGGIVDVFWPGLDKPVRIDLFGDTVDTLGTFEPSTQRTLQKLDELTFGPAKEIHLDDATIAAAKRALRDLADELDFPTKKLSGTLADLDAKLAFFGIEKLMPALYPALETPLELAARARPDLTVVVDDAAALRGAVEVQWADYVEHHRQSTHKGELSYPPASFLVDNAQLSASIARHTAVELAGLLTEGRATAAAAGTVVEIACAPTADLRADILRETTRTDLDGNPASLLGPLAARITAARKKGRCVLLPVASLGGVERVRDLLKNHGVEVHQLKEAPALVVDGAPALPREPSVHAWTYIARPVDPSRGAELPHLQALVIAEEEIFGKRARRSTQKVRKGGFKTTLADLSEGDHVVHVEHGVGLFQGLVRMAVRGIEQDYLLLTYDGGDKLYLPVHRINLVQKYAGPGGTSPRLDKLGGTGWESTKKKVKAAAIAMAQDLLALYAKRELAHRDKHPHPDDAYWQFESQFPFETTPDQQKAIDDVLADMQRERPMDRLICGDVGYGKTEVGMRAAMLCITGGRQVAVLAPTTVLAQQHFLTFQERFKGAAANIEVISRFKKPSEVKEILARAKEGKLDVLIGTHRLLSGDVGFKDLGLILVDEEQRFGVKAKEQLKKWKTSVDVLTLTATPIPRTLQMGFFGVRDMSVIETPPVDRRAIRTATMKKDDEVIREAVLRELARGGQVYFVHNRVRSIQATADYIQRLVPEARIAVGHGQMEEDELEEVMLRFMKHEVNVLVCTAIIETGIDVPSANTMFIDHAEDFGLAQLYQLRGRVGRSKERAFAYLLIEGSTETLHPDARKRLEILQRFTELGAGFQVAQHDLELRGAGDLLGKNQHGHVAAVGYDLYAELLREAVEELKGQKLDDVPDPDVNLPVQALIPDKYIVDLHERLQVYQQLATCKETADIYDVVGALSDQYGEPPREVTTLADVMALKLRLRQIAARAIEVAAPIEKKGDTKKDKGSEIPKVVITLGDKARLDPQKLLAFVEKDKERLRLTPQMKLVFSPTAKDWQTAGEDPIPLCRELLRTLTDAAAAKR